MTAPVIVSPDAPPVSEADWDAFWVPEGYRAEIIQGELIVTPAPLIAHNRAMFRLAKLLEQYLPTGLGFEVVPGPEWRLVEGGMVAATPQPDLAVIRAGLQTRISGPPLLAVEILSRSDLERMDSGMQRIEGKRTDYAVNGLVDYLELWPGPVRAPKLHKAAPIAVRYELHDGTLEEVDRVEGNQSLVTERPFGYEFCPNDLI